MTYGLPGAWARPCLLRPTTVHRMIGPVVLVTAFVVAGALTSGWAGAVGAGIAGVAMVGAVAAGAAFWSQAIGRHIDPQMAWEQAPRPPGFRPLCDAVYRRRLPARPGPTE